MEALPARNYPTQYSLYCRYALSYRDLEEMTAKQGLSVDHGTIKGSESYLSSALILATQLKRAPTRYH